jgi:hypothetical protein
LDDEEQLAAKVAWLIYEKIIAATAIATGVAVQLRSPD